MSLIVNTLFHLWRKSAVRTFVFTYHSRHLHNLYKLSNRDKIAENSLSFTEINMMGNESKLKFANAWRCIFSGFG